MRETLLADRRIVPRNAEDMRGEQNRKDTVEELAHLVVPVVHIRVGAARVDPCPLRNELDLDHTPSDERVVLHHLILVRSVLILGIVRPTVAISDRGVLITHRTGARNQDRTHHLYEVVEVILFDHEHETNAVAEAVDRQEAEVLRERLQKQMLLRTRRVPDLDLTTVRQLDRELVSRQRALTPVRDRVRETLIDLLEARAPILVVGIQLRDDRDILARRSSKQPPTKKRVDRLALTLQGLGCIPTADSLEHELRDAELGACEVPHRRTGLGRTNQVQ